jgi:hypothetical protein
MNKPVALAMTRAPASWKRSGAFQDLGSAALELALPGATLECRSGSAYGLRRVGNLMIDAHTTDPAAPVAAREATILSFKGRAVLDVAKRELKLMNLTGNVNPDEVLSPERRRRYEFDADTLKLSSFDEQGQVTSVAIWRRRP